MGGTGRKLPRAIRIGSQESSSNQRGATNSFRACARSLLTVFRFQVKKKRSRTPTEIVIKHGPLFPAPAKTIFEPARQIPVFAESDVPVVGGGPAGTAAAIAAGRSSTDIPIVR
jgi:hypothetical protein